MFECNKYTRIYYSIILHSQSRVKPKVTEKHHIIPKSLSGSNLSNNIAHLTPREHFICHKLLTKMTSGKSRAKMSYALWSMTRSSNKHSRIIKSVDYECARKKFISEHPMKHLSDEQKVQHGLKISKATKGKTKVWSEEAKQKRSEAYQSGKLRNNNAKYWLVIHPNGKEERIDNMTLFCKAHGLSKGNVSAYKKSKGYVFKDLGR